jgi:Lectin C-type domain
MPGAGTAIAPGHKVSWREAKDDCAKQNASLVSIRSKTDLICLEKVIEQSSEPMWIGLEGAYDVVTRKIIWKWMNPEVEDGSYSNWARGESYVRLQTYVTCLMVFSYKNLVEPTCMGIYRVCKTLTCFFLGIE